MLGMLGRFGLTFILPSLLSSHCPLTFFSLKTMVCPLVLNVDRCSFIDWPASDTDIVASSIWTVASVAVWVRVFRLKSDHLSIPEEYTDESSLSAMSLGCESGANTALTALESPLDTASKYLMTVCSGAVAPPPFLITRK